MSLEYNLFNLSFKLADISDILVHPPALLFYLRASLFELSLIHSLITLPHRRLTIKDILNDMCAWQQQRVSRCTARIYYGKSLTTNSAIPYTM